MGEESTFLREFSESTTLSKLSKLIHLGVEQTHRAQ